MGERAGKRELIVVKGVVYASTDFFIPTILGGRCYYSLHRREIKVTAAEGNEVRIH